MNIFYAHKFGNVVKMDNFYLLAWEETTYIIFTKEKWILSLKCSNKIPGSDGFAGEFYQIFDGKIIPTVLEIFEKTEEERTLSSVILIPKPDKDTTGKDDYGQIFISYEHKHKILLQNIYWIKQYIKR